MTTTDTPTDPLVAALAFISAGFDYFFVAPFRKLTRWLLPHVGTAFGSFGRTLIYALMSLPFLAAAWRATLYLIDTEPGYTDAILAASAATLIDWAAVVAGDALYSAAAIAAAYFLWGIVPYRPRDARAYRTRQTPNSRQAWESLFAKTVMYGSVSVTLVAGMLMGDFATRHFGAPLLGVAAIAYAAGHGILRVRDVQIQEHYDGDHLLPRSAADLGQKWSRIDAAFVLVALVIVAPYVLGVDVVTALFYGHVLVVLSMLRTFRFTVYEDDAANTRLSPLIPLWGLVTRTPMAYSLVALVLLGGFSSTTPATVIVGVFVPLAGFLGYVGWRRIALDGNLYAHTWRADTDPDDYDRERETLKHVVPQKQWNLLDPEVRVSNSGGSVARSLTECRSYAGACGRRDLGKQLSAARRRLHRAKTYAQRRDVHESARELLDEFEAHLDSVEDPEKREKARNLIEDARGNIDRNEQHNELVGPKPGDWLQHLLP